MNAKTYLTWLRMKAWCEANPGKSAVIATPDGSFSIVYHPSTGLKGT